MRSHLRRGAASVPLTLIVLLASGAPAEATDRRFTVERRRLDRPSHARWPARAPGHLDQCHAHTARAAGSPVQTPLPHRGGSAGARGPGCRATGDRRRSASQAASAGARRHRQLQPVLVRFRQHGPPDPADLARRRSARWPRAAPSRGRSAARRRAGAQHGRARVHESLGPLHLTRRARVDHPGWLQQRLPDRPDEGLRRHPLRDDSRRADHPARWPPAPSANPPPLRGRLARPMGRRHPGRRNGQLRRSELDSDECRVRAGSRASRRARRCASSSVSRGSRPDRIDYEARIEDPAVFTRPWTLAFPLTRDDEYRIYEYACHEGNRAIEGVLRGARYQERVPGPPRR